MKFILFFLLSSIPAFCQMPQGMIYNIMLDRFYDGDTTNNIPVYAYRENSIYHDWNCKMLPKIFDPNKKSFNKYWGGDLKGLYEKLEYLKDLGVKAVLISPIFENVVGYVTIKESLPGITAYHGYWLKDFYRLDPHFISYDPKSKDDLFVQGEKQLKELIKKAHSLGLKIILDINVNHSSPTLEGLKRIVIVEDYELQDGAVFENGKFIAAKSKYFEEKFKMKNKEKNWFHDYPAIVWDKGRRAELNLKGTEPSKTEIEKGMLHGLADFNQENPKVRKYLINALKKWTKFGVDGYRVDAIKHFPSSFFMELKSALLTINPSLFFIGEWYGAGAHNKESMEFAKRTGVTLFDFEKNNQIRTIYMQEDADYSHIKEIINAPKSVITFFENQDMPRVLSLKNLNKKYYDEMLKLLFVLPGTPYLYYGSEQYLHNDSYKYKDRVSFGQTGNDPWNRDYMNWNDKKYKNNNAYIIIKRLSELRENNSALSRGDLKLYDTDNSSLIFERTYKKHKVLYASSKYKKNISINATLPDGAYKDLIDNKEYKIKGHQLNIELAPFKAVILSTIF